MLKLAGTTRKIMGDAMFAKYFSIFLISMVPLIELRGAIPIALGMGLDTIPSIVICAFGNMLPVPIIYLFAHRFLLWGLDKPVIGPVCRFFHEKGEKTAGLQQIREVRPHGRPYRFCGNPHPRHRCLDRDPGSQLSGNGHEGNHSLRLRRRDPCRDYHGLRQSGWHPCIRIIIWEEII